MNGVASGINAHLVVQGIYDKAVGFIYTDVRIDNKETITATRLDCCIEMKALQQIHNLYQHLPGQHRAGPAALVLIY